MSGGVFVISLDFELHWGMHDKRTEREYERNLRGTWESVPRILELFEHYRVHATWATVGMLFCDSGTTLRAAAPLLLPEYDEPHLSPYRLLDRVGPDERADPFHLAPSLVRRIVETPGQELASHTFSHYYCLEPGQTRGAFAADLTAARNVAARFQTTLSSLVFPRTQVNDAYLPEARAQGFLCFRGPEPGWMNAPAGRRGHSLARRAVRLADSYLPLVRATSFDRRLSRRHDMVNVPASRFLRPWSRRLRALEPLKSARIRREMSHAASRGRGYHLWWHPENFGADLARNLETLRRILEHFDDLRGRFDFESLTMQELSERAR